MVQPGTRIDLSKLPTSPSVFSLSKKKASDLLRVCVERLSDLQTRLFAERAQSLLLIFQGMDASGKDSTIRHVTTGVNPAGIRVHSYGVPTKDDLAQSYFQRHWRDLPIQGNIGIHNRSHYEEVVVTRVHPALLKLRGFKTSAADESFWQERFEDIRAFERHLTRQSRTSIIKFFLHLSKDEQLKRLIERLDDPNKNWKFDISDVRERLYWDDYQHAYNEAITATAIEQAPWYVIPADVKRFARLAVAEIVVEKLIAMNPQFPAPAANVEKAKRALQRT